jgi:hypothetical protein
MYIIRDIRRLDMKEYTIDDLREEEYKYNKAYGHLRNEDLSPNAFLSGKIVSITNINNYLNSRISKLESIILGEV